MGGGIREKFRSSLRISGGNRRQPQTPPPSPDHAAGGDEEGGGGTEGPDLLRALPDDVLIHILGFLPSAAAAARTSVLSHRWRLLWTQLPVLLFVYPEKPLQNAGVVAARTSARSLHGRRRRARMRALRSQQSAPADPLLRAGAALAGHAAPELRLLAIADIAADPDDADAVLLAAAPRLTGSLVLLFRFRALEWIGATDDVDAIELPCFEKLENIELNLPYLGLALPPSGVFDRLTTLRLKKVQFLGPCNLGDAVSSERCPSLQRLCVAHARGVSSLDIRSESLINLDLNSVEGLQQLTVVAPMLKHLKVADCFIGELSVLGRSHDVSPGY
ncbi:hypothetical protein QOZ80_7BG0590350 [Eleusine coracana subsp. coracana]|nr:hypothetical protein QOZ80_7BG0590350 [Eleusine coracana subsp. coracana]